MKTLSLKRLMVLAALSVAAYLPTGAFANATVYQHCNFKGQRISLAPGNYDLKDLERRGVRNDDISSLQVRPGYEIIIYQHHRFGGRSLKFRLSGE